MHRTSRFYTDQKINLKWPKWCFIFFCGVDFFVNQKINLTWPKWWYVFFCMVNFFVSLFGLIFWKKFFARLSREEPIHKKLFKYVERHISVFRAWHDAWTIAHAHAVTCANQEKGVGGCWKACPKLKLCGLISPAPNAK